MRSSSWTVVATLGLATACGGTTVVEASDRGAGAGGADGSGGSATTTASSGVTTSSTSSGAGGSTMGWEHECSMTGIAIDKGFGAVVLVDRACPDDGWSLSFYDGATAYGYASGFVGALDFRACDATGGQRILLSGFIDGAGELMLDGGSYQEAPGVDYELASGTLTITVDGDEGQVVEGEYEGSFAPLQNDGPPIALSGSVRACHLPELALP